MRSNSRGKSEKGGGTCDENNWELGITLDNISNEFEPAIFWHVDVADEQGVQACVTFEKLSHA